MYLPPLKVLSTNTLIIQKDLENTWSCKYLDLFNVCMQVNVYKWMNERKLNLFIKQKFLFRNVLFINKFGNKDFQWRFY